MTVLRCVPYILRQIVRHPVRSALTVAGLAIAMFLFTTVQAMQHGVAEATQATANETTLVVYRKDRFCPMTSQLPQDYVGRIERLEQVVSALPVKVVVSNCRTSLDVVTFRGVPKDGFLEKRGDRLTLIAGSIDGWKRRSDAVLIGETLANRRGLRPGMTFDAAGITAYVAGIIRSEDPQDQNVAYASLDFVQLATTSGLGVVTQFNVTVADSSRLDAVADTIDEMFATASDPTSTMSEKAFVAQIADDVVELVGFAGWLGIGCLIAVLALVGNAIVLGVQGRIAEHAVLQTIGYSRTLIAAMIVGEGVVLALLGGAIGAAVSWSVTEYGSFALSVEGQSIPIVADAGLLLAGVGTCAALGVIAGLVPAWQASRREIASCFRVV